MFVISRVGDVQTDFVQARGSSEILFPKGKLLNGNVFDVAEAVHKGLRGIGNAFCLIEADVIAVLEFRNRLFAHVFIQRTAYQVVEHTVPQCGFGYGHFIEFQFFKCRHHHGKPAGKDFDAFRFQVFKFGLFDRAGFDDTFGKGAHAFIGNVCLLRQFGCKDVADGFCRTRSSDGGIPTFALHVFADALDFVTGGRNGRLEVFGGDFVLEEAQAVGNAA